MASIAAIGVLRIALVIHRQASLCSMNTKVEINDKVRDLFRRTRRLEIDIGKVTVLRSQRAEKRVNVGVQANRDGIESEWERRKKENEKMLKMKIKMEGMEGMKDTWNGQRTCTRERR